MAIVLAYLNFRLTRESNKHKNNSELRTQSYIDFISAVAEVSSSKEHFTKRPKELTAKLTNAKTRIAIYGDSEVIVQLAKFDKNFGVINNEESRNSFLLVVQEMRKSATGRSASGIKNDISQVLFGNSNGL